MHPSEPLFIHAVMSSAYIARLVPSMLSRISGGTIIATLNSSGKIIKPWQRFFLVIRGSQNVSGRDAGRTTMLAVTPDTHKRPPCVILKRQTLPRGAFPRGTYRRVAG